MKRALFRCDRARVPTSLSGVAWDLREDINCFDGQNLHLRIENISHALRAQIDDRTTDLVHLAAYVYAADQSVSRGGATDVFGDAWRREIYLCVPVSDPDFWSDQDVVKDLTEVLNFATDDHWFFHFSKAEGHEEQLVFNLNTAELMQAPDSVVLFSGGADSLCAAVEEVTVHNRRPALVSHRPAPVTDSRQGALRSHLQRYLPEWDFPHTSIWVNRMQKNPKDNAQRSRPFLFASLGAGVAESIGVKRVVLADNGVVSLNLPINDQIIGAKASRSTHPKFLDSMNKLLSRVLAGQPQLTNPLASRTRAESLAVLANAGLESLLQETNSCSNWRGHPNVTPHCGVCYQCVDRRFASQAAGLQEHDLAEKYARDIFRQELREGSEVLVATSYVRFARRIDKLLEEEDLFFEFPELANCILASDRDADGTARTLVAMLKRHARDVIDVLSAEISRAGNELAAERLPETCLVRLSIHSEHPEAVPLRPVAPQLSSDEAEAVARLRFKSDQLIEINGTPAGGKGNVVLVNGVEAVLDDASFVPFLRLVLALYESEDGYLSREELRYGSGLDGELALMPQGFDQALHRIRRSFRGRIGRNDPKEFIQVERGKVRLSTYHRFVVVDCETLLRHEDPRVRGLAQRIKSQQTLQA